MRFITKRSTSSYKVLSIVALSVLSAGPITGCVQGAEQGGESVVAEDDAISRYKEEERNKKVVSQFVEEFKNKANHDIVDTLFTPDFVSHLPIPGIPPTRDGMKLVGKGIVGGFPDVHVTVEELVADHDIVVERTIARGTNTGEFNGIPATGKELTWSELHMYRLENGKIVELTSEINLLGIFSQLGVFPCQ